MVDQQNSSDSDRNLKPGSNAEELSAPQLRAVGPISPAELERIAAGASDGDLLGQQRALEAIRLAIGIDARGYNVFVSGLRGRDEREPILRLIEERAAQMPTPGDWLYVHNFENPESPVSIYVNAGQGRELRDRMRDLVTYIREQLPKAFRQEDFEQERTQLKEKYNKQAQELFGKLESSARQRGFVIHSGPMGQIIFVPMIGGKPPESPEALAKHMSSLSEEERAQIAKQQAELQEELAELLVRQQEILRDLSNDVRAIERTFAGRLIAPAIQDIERRLANPAVSRYLAQVLDHILTHLDRFRDPGPGPDGRPPENIAALMGPQAAANFFEYQVNLLVDNSGRKGAPVVNETAPTYRNLF